VKKRTHGGEDATLQAYLREIAAFPSLTSEQERALGRRIRRHRDSRAFRRLVESNLRLVAGYARACSGTGVGLLELIDEANVGLMEAARRFDPEADGEFTSYARWWIRHAIMHALAAQGHVLVAPGQVTAVPRCAPQGGGPAADRTMCEATTTAFCGVDEADRLLEDPAVRLAIIGQVGDTLHELTPRERDVIRLRLGLDGARPLSRARTGGRLCLSADRVEQIEARARVQLRRSQKARELRTALN